MSEIPTPLYKVLREDGSPYHGGKVVWSLPTDGKPGEWLRVGGKLVPCHNGLHLCDESHLIEWLGPVIFEAEAHGEWIDHGNKLVVREARLIRRVDTWTGRTARLFACDCAERVLHLYEREHPNDSRARTAIEVARLYADGNATLADLTAAGDAAGAAAWDAAWDAAGDAAWDAAWAAAWDAAWAAEREWQTQRLMAYLRGEVG